MKLYLYKNQGKKKFLGPPESKIGLFITQSTAIE